MPLFSKHSLFMAPMVDLTHVAYQDLVRSLTGCDLFYSEMLNARIVPGERPGTSVYLKWSSLDDLIFQIAGNDVDKMQESAAKLDSFNPYGVDINMGCYMNKVTCHGWGAGLMKDPLKAQEIVIGARKVVKHSLSVKFRIGYMADVKAMIDFASMLQDAGADFLVLHARTVEDGLSRSAKWEYIAALKDALKIPVVGNGDVKTAQDAVNMFSQTGCDGVMVGRQAIIQPWIFRDIKSLLKGEVVQAPPALKDVMLDLQRLLGLNFTPDVALKRFKTAIIWLSQNLTFGHHLSKNVNREKTMEGARDCIMAAFEANIN